jgi:hypothetical protein
VSHTMISTRSEYVSTGTYENLSSGDVNPGPVPSRCDLLEDSLYHEIWTTLFVMRLGMTTYLGHEDLGMSPGPFPREVNTFS